MGRMVMCRWLRKHGVSTLDTCKWNELTHILLELSHPNGYEIENCSNESVQAEMPIIKAMKDPTVIVVFDIEILDLSSDIWKEQLNYLDEFSSFVKFAWMLNYDTPSAVKMELRRRGQPLVVNKPLYKAKMIHIFDSVKRELVPESQVQSSDDVTSTSTDSPLHQEAELLPTSPSTVDSGDARKAKVSSCSAMFKNSLLEPPDVKQHYQGSYHNEQPTVNGCTKDQVTSNGNKPVGEQKCLQGIRILVVEDTPLLQKVAKAMLERLGAIVFIVGDGLQAVDALNSMLSAEMSRRASPLQEPWSETALESPQYDLILMDCQASNRTKINCLTYSICP